MSEYEGTERRIHKVYVTRNTEYHLRERLCVGVKDRRSGRWLEGHLALSKLVEGGLTPQEHGLIPHGGLPSIGDAIYFRNGERDLVTSRLERIERPEKGIVETYKL